MIVTSSGKETIKIQRADMSVINKLIDICRKCFPTSLKHNVPREIARKRWAILISSPSLETYIIMVENKTVGFYTINIDVNGYARERARAPFVDKFAFYIGQISCLIAHPSHIKHIIEILRNRLHYSQKEALKPNSSQIQASTIDKTAWGELQGILPEYQGKGLAKHMQKFILQRCIDLNKHIIAGNVKVNNLSTRSLLESFGYVATSESPAGGIIYKKPLP